MDVVKRNVSALRGSVSIASIDGQGATVSIRLPLTLAILGGLAVAAGGERFVIPMQAIRRCIAMTPGAERSELHGLIETPEAAIPFVRLARMFALDDDHTAEQVEQVVLIEAEGMTIGLVTDAVIGEMQAVLKPLGELFRELDGVAASTIFADGRVGLVIDVGALVLMLSENARGAA